MIDRIVRQSGVSAGLLYRYFTGKDDMIAAIAAERHEQRERRLREDPVVAYPDLIRGLGDPAGRDALRLSLQVWAETVRSEPIRDLVRSGVDRPARHAADLLADADAAVDTEAVLRIFVAVYQGLLLQTVLDDTLDHDRLATAAEHLLRTALSPPS